LLLSSDFISAVILFALLASAAAKLVRGFHQLPFPIVKYMLPLVDEAGIAATLVMPTGHENASTPKLGIGMSADAVAVTLEDVPNLI
jgi:hypothetical protein